MRAFPTQWFKATIRLALVCVATLFCVSAALGQTQSNAADLSGIVRDPQGAVVVNASVTALNSATNFSRTVSTSSEGYYRITNLPPGDYEITVEAPGYKKTVFNPYKLTVGASADLPVALEVGQISEAVTISSGDQPVVESGRTAVTNTIEQARIESYPINERSATGFALTLSTVNRGNDRAVGPAPSSGLNIGGQRGRSTLVQVDGADNTDNSVNASRSTVSQEAVQEYQVATNSYAPEFGRAIGGIINVVTKSGTKDFRGDLFGFIRHKTIQSRNAFAPVIDNDLSKKPPFTRVQYGATFGGPIKRDRTFFFTAFEQRRRQESGFFTSNVGAGLTSSVTIGAPFLPFTNVYSNLTAAQAAFIQGELASGNPARISQAITYATFASAGGQTALNGVSSLRSPGGAIAAGSIIGGRFFISGAPVPLTSNDAGQLVAFRPLLALPQVFPISESTTYFSTRVDHRLNNDNQLTVRFGYNPSDLSGIQDESQNQTLGQNDFSRTGTQTLRDISFVSSLSTILSKSMVNEGRFSFSRRHATFRSQTQDGPALQIAGTAFIGPNPFSPVDRVEKRYQLTDNVTYVYNTHTFKFGGDVNFVDVKASFQLNFPGLFNFGTFGLQPFITGLSASAPPLTPVQSYGAGIPGVFIEGFGNPNSSIKNRPLAFFAQDSWKIRRNLTFNYGVRYDVELTDTIAPVAFTDPLSHIALSAGDLQTAQDVLGVQQGFPRDKNNFAPRVGLAWDIGGNGRTVLRAAYGIFYDHPLLAIAFNSDIADASQQQQFTTVLPGSPSPTANLNLLQIFQGTVVPGVTPGVAASAQYLNGRIRFNDQTFPGFGPVLPFTLAVAKDFQYASASQANLTVEHQIGKDTSFSASYIFVGAHHLPHPEDVNAPRIDLLAENFRRFSVGNPALCGTNAACLANGRAPTGFAEAVLFPIPTASNALFTVLVPGLVAVNNITHQGIVSPLAANFFRPSAPNYFFVQSVTGGAVTPAVLNTILASANTLRTPGAISPFGDVSAQLSDGNSSYNALNLELKRRLSNNFQFLASYTLSHSIDDSSDLQTLLKPQDNRNFRAERSDSLFDQRHRFVFSGFITSPTNWRNSSSLATRFFSNFTVAPILELSSGRPFNIITATDTNADLQSSNDRPSVAADGTLVIPAFLSSGNLGRNSGITHKYASLDMRVMRSISFGEHRRLDLIAEGFNLFNRFNEAAASPFFDDVNAFNQRAGNGRYFSRPTAAYDPRQFQFGIKFNF